MPNLFVLINHKLTRNQIKDSANFLRVNKIYEPEEEIKNIWSNISPEGALDLNNLNLIINWLEISANKNDYVLVQGEFGSTFYIVDFCFQHGLIPIYATSKREYKEIKLEDGSVKRIHVFRHVQFRKYMRFEELPNE